MQAAKTEVDPNTFVPPAVRRQAAAADAAFRAQRNEAPPEEKPADPPAPAGETTTPPPAPVESTAPKQPEFAQGGVVAPEVTSQVTPPPKEEETWERQYNAILSRYKRAENDIHSMSEHIASLQQTIGNMQRAPQSTPAELRPQSFITPEEVTEYGGEFLDVVARKAKEELSPEVMALKTKLSRLEQQLEGNAKQQAARAQAEMEATMDQRLPQWRDINYLDEFKRWLALPDTFSGAIRHDLLRAAYAQNNTPRVFAFFKGFLDQEAALVPQGVEPHPAGNGKVPLETFAAPGRAKTSAATTAPVEKPVFTHAQIAQFYAESAAGKWKGREEEYNRIDRAIFEAGREGRVR